MLFQCRQGTVFSRHLHNQRLIQRLIGGVGIADDLRMHWRMPAAAVNHRLAGLQRG